MHLLDLPPEIFYGIIRRHVRDVELSTAWKARAVCKTFADAIDDAVFGHSPARYYRSLKGPRARLVKENMHKILVRMSPARCNSTYLLDYVDATIDFLFDFLHDTSRALRDSYKMALCNAIAASLPAKDIFAYLIQGPYKESLKIREHMWRRDTVGMLAAAAAVENHQALQYLRKKVRNMSTCSRIFGAPLMAAAANGSLKGAEFVHHYMKFKDGMERRLRSTIEECMNLRKDKMLPVLFDWYVACNSNSENSQTMMINTKWSKKKYFRWVRRRQWAQRRQWTQWTQWAIANGNLEVLRRCEMSD